MFTTDKHRITIFLIVIIIIVIRKLYNDGKKIARLKESLIK